MSGGAAWPLDCECARCHHTVWHPAWRRCGTRPYHLSCDPGPGPGNRCRYCGADMGDDEWQHDHRCDEADLYGEGCP